VRDCGDVTLGSVVVVKHPKKIVLHCRKGCDPRLDSLIEEFIRDGVAYVGVVGVDCAKVEDIIDELVVGFGECDRHILTASHPNETVEDAVRFASPLTGEFEGEVHLMEF
jgi:hypothetical protein